MGWGWSTGDEDSPLGQSSGTRRPRVLHHLIRKHVKDCTQRNVMVHTILGKIALAALGRKRLAEVNNTLLLVLLTLSSAIPRPLSAGSDVLYFTDHFKSTQTSLPSSIATFYFII